MKKVSAIFLSCCFLVNCVIFPFCNFQDTGSAKKLFQTFLQKDDDADVLEFIANDMLNMSGIFEDEDDDEQENQMPQQHPIQPIQISQGFLYCVQSFTLEEKKQPVSPRVFCFYVNNNYKMDFSSMIFHPPTFIS